MRDCLPPRRTVRIRSFVAWGRGRRGKQAGLRGTTRRAHRGHHETYGKHDREQCTGREMHFRPHLSKVRPARTDVKCGMCTVVRDELGCRQALAEPSLALKANSQHSILVAVAVTSEPRAEAGSCQSELVVKNRAVDVRPELLGDVADSVLKDLAAPALVGFDPFIFVGIVEVTDTGSRPSAHDLREIERCISAICSGDG